MRRMGACGGCLKYRSLRVTEGAQKAITKTRVNAVRRVARARGGRHSALSPFPFPGPFSFPAPGLARFPIPRSLFPVFAVTQGTPGRVGGSVV